MLAIHLSFFYAAFTGVEKIVYFKTKNAFFKTITWANEAENIFTYLATGRCERTCVHAQAHTQIYTYQNSCKIQSKIMLEPVLQMGSKLNFGIL